MEYHLTGYDKTETGSLPEDILESIRERIAYHTTMVQNFEYSPRKDISLKVAQCFVNNVYHKCKTKDDGASKAAKMLRRTYFIHAEYDWETFVKECAEQTVYGARENSQGRQRQE